MGALLSYATGARLSLDRRIRERVEEIDEYIRKDPRPILIPHVQTFRRSLEKWSMDQLHSALFESERAFWNANPIFYAALTEEITRRTCIDDSA